MERLSPLQPVIERFTGDLEDLLFLFQMSTGVASPDALRYLISIESARGTRYYTAALDGEIVGMVGVWFDPSGAVAGLEPPQIIDVAVSPLYRLRGVARALMDVAVNEVHLAGYDRVWLYTDGNSAGMLAFYRRLGFRLVSVVPDWFGDDTVKAILRLDIK